MNETGTITPRQEAVLRKVRKGQKFNLHELAQRAGIGYENARHFARKLEAAGYFGRVAGGGRGIELFLRRLK